MNSRITFPARLCLLFLLLAATPAWILGSPALAQDSGGSESVELSQGVRQLFEESEAGKPVVAADLQEYYAQLPDHARELFSKAVDAGLISSASHASELLSLKLSPDKMELVLKDNCILCHTDKDMQDDTTLWHIRDDGSGSTTLILQKFLADVHFRQGLSCSGCHGGHPDQTEMSDDIYERWPDSEQRHRDRTWIPEFCGRCHSDPAFMRGFNPSLPTDQLAKYRESKHGQLLLGQKDSKAAQCVSCHGVHGIQGSDSRRSSTFKSNIPATCGKCHADAEYMAGYKTEDGSPLPTTQLEQYRKSVHGQALLVDGDQGAPACNDCHGNHAAMPPQISSVSEVCRTCHSGNGKLFDGSKHKQVFSAHGWPECAKCHGTHDISKPSDTMLVTEPGHLCFDCHAKYAPDNPKCNDTAAHFHERITTMEAAQTNFEQETHTLAAKGLDVDALAVSLSELNDALRQSRSAVHAFDRSDFDEVADVGL
ncbi:MAG TPA: cytochrome c3 family protein, partial [Candidatus Krumholzibacteria bacterium]|nr:cytochrome c3 family protein [Candidatus Krumholzibacteria bacterium]